MEVGLKWCLSWEVIRVAIEVNVHEEVLTGCWQSRGSQLSIRTVIVPDVLHDLDVFDCPIGMILNAEESVQSRTALGSMPFCLFVRCDVWLGLLRRFRRVVRL